MVEEKRGNNNKYSQRFCDERHKETDRRINEVEQATKGIKNWLIGVLISTIFNLIAIIGLLISQYGK